MKTAFHVRQASVQPILSGKLSALPARVQIPVTAFPTLASRKSCIAMNGVYENAVLTALKNHSNLSEIVLCVDNDEGGIEAVDRLRDILADNGYSDVKRLAPEYKDWNEVLKALQHP